MAVKNVTVNEDFFQGHFPGPPLMPGVLMIETLAQVAYGAAGSSMDGRAGAPATGVASTCAVWTTRNSAGRWCRAIVSGSKSSMGARRSRLVLVHAVAYLGDDVVAEAELVMGLVGVRPSERDAAAGTGTARGRDPPTAIVHPSARVGAGYGDRPVCDHRRPRARSDAIAESGPDGDRRSDRDRRWQRDLPDGVGRLIPQDLKFGGESTRLVIGQRNVIREFVTIHRGTAGGGGVTRIGDRNLFMAYAHVAHDCQVGNETIFANGATLGGHVLVEDYATVGAFSGVHQYCRVGRHASLAATRS